MRFNVPEDVMIAMPKCWKVEPTSAGSVEDMACFEDDVPQKFVDAKGTIMRNEGIRHGRRYLRHNGNSLSITHLTKSQHKATLACQPAVHPTRRRTSVGAESRRWRCCRTSARWAAATEVTTAAGKGEQTAAAAEWTAVGGWRAARGPATRPTTSGAGHSAPWTRSWTRKEPHTWRRRGRRRGGRCRPQ